MSTKNIGLVIIGRNEAEHLANNLPKLAGLFKATVFVDSNSSDDSVAVAEKNEVSVLQLDLSKPFTAARARNAGYEKLLQENTDLEFVQFIDGDCELLPAFVVLAQDYLEQHADVGVVAGRRRERYPDRSIYNANCEVEWNTPVGDAQACGGDFLIRTAVMSAVGGFNESLIAGEEPELCVRIRQAGHKIYRIDSDMTIHDANMHKISQWWKRAERAGYAYVQDFAIHGGAPQYLYRRDVIKIFIYGGLFFFAIAAGIFIDWKFLLLLLFYPLQAFRIYLKFDHPDHNRLERRAFSMSCGFAYLPQIFGVLRFLWRRLLGKQGTIIEYK